MRIKGQPEDFLRFLAMVVLSHRREASMLALAIES
jgi:hypothetical protein